MRKTKISLEAEAYGVIVLLDPREHNSNHIGFSVTVLANMGRKMIAVEGGLGDLWVNPGGESECGGTGLWTENGELYSETVFKLLDEVRRFHPKLGDMVEEGDLL